MRRLSHGPVHVNVVAHPLAAVGWPVRKGRKEENVFKNLFKVSVKETSGKRATYRAKIDGLHVKVVGRPSVYAASDLSPTGVGLSGRTGMYEGEIYVLSLFLKGKRVAADLRAKVVRVAPTFTGLVFVTPDRRQTDSLHAIVLSEQKAQAEERKQVRYRLD